MSKSPKRKNPPTRSPTSNPSTTSYTAIAIEYAEAAVADRGRSWAGKRIRQAARRFLRDLARTQAKRPPFLFSTVWADKHCRFIEQLPHVEGVWATANLRLEPPQIFFLVNLFGFRNHAGGRRFTEALLCIARKNAKSTLAAGIMLSCMCLESENGPQLVSAATTGSQARIVWDYARRMVQRADGLVEAFDLETYANAIARPEVGGTFKPINSKASTQDGLNPSHAALDEIHAHKTHDLLNVLRSAAGARRNPLWLYTTTEGYETPGPWPELRNFAYLVLDEVLRADHFFAAIWAIDDDDAEDREFDPAIFIKSNPLLPSNPTLAEELRKLAVNAQAMPGTQAEFRIKRLNRRATAATGWLNLHKWRRNTAEVPLELLRGRPCYGAFDLASTTDMCAWRLLWELDGHYYTRGRFWVPADAVRQRTERRTAPYATWVANGLVTQTDGDAVDYSRIEADILADCREFKPVQIAYDSWNAAQLVQVLQNQGLELVQFIQGPRSYNMAMKACEVAYTRGRLHHGNDPVLTWNFANLVARHDQNMNQAPDRKRSADKIDGAAALLMAFGLHLSDDPGALDRALSNPVSA